MLKRFIGYAVVSSLAAMMMPAQASANESLRAFKSAYAFDETVSRLEKGIKEKGMSIFTVIDHAQAARDAGLDMPATKVIVFGNPKAGTPLMKKHPTLALDLPLRVLVTQGSEQVSVVMHTYQSTFDQLNLPVEDGVPLGGAEKLVQSLVTAP